MTRSPLVPLALVFVGAIVADAHGLATWAAVGALGALAFPRARLAACIMLAALVLASRTARFSSTVVGDTRTDPAGTAFAFSLDSGIVVQAHLHGGVVAPRRPSLSP